MINKPVRVVIVGEAKDAFVKLNEIAGRQIKSGTKNSNDITLLNSIRKKISLIKENPFYGDNIRKNLIPKNLNVPNLWRVELSNFWRMLYTIRGDEIEIVCFVLVILPHKKYNKMFGYK